MTEECQARWKATKEQIETIIIHSTKNIGHQFSRYLEKPQFPSFNCCNASECWRWIQEISVRSRK